MARPQVADRGTASSMEGGYGYIEYAIADSRQGMEPLQRVSLFWYCCMTELHCNLFLFSSFSNNEAQTRKKQTHRMLREATVQNVLSVRFFIVIAIISSMKLRCCWIHDLVSQSWISSNSTTREDGSRTGWPLPEAVITAVRAPDDGCQQPKHVELSTDM